MHSYFIVMIDYGKRGQEAVVDPEVTRREVVSRIASGEYKNIAFIHHVHFAGLQYGVCEDVTDELKDEANALSLQAAE